MHEIFNRFYKVQGKLTYIVLVVKPGSHLLDNNRCPLRSVGRGCKGLGRKIAGSNPSRKTGQLGIRQCKTLCLISKGPFWLLLALISVTLG